MMTVYTFGKWEKIALAIAFILACCSVFIVKSIHTSDIDKSLSDRVLLLEKQIHERVIPRIYIEKATVYNGEGEIVIERIEKEKEK